MLGPAEIDEEIAAGCDALVLSERGYAYENRGETNLPGLRK